VTRSPRPVTSATSVVQRLRRTSRAQPVRYVAVGGLVTLTYLGLTLLLAGPLGVPIALAIVVGYAVAITLHFLLQRHYVFAHVASFRLELSAQVVRYVVIGGTQLALTVASTRWLPSLLGISAKAAYVSTVVVLTAGGFLLLRHRVFHVTDR
jgi:putative flippase GtrA